ncbi:MAG: hypothetical protein ACLUIQ_07800 [Dialister invisus]
MELSDCKRAELENQDALQLGMLAGEIGADIVIGTILTAIG